MNRPLMGSNLGEFMQRPQPRVSGVPYYIGERRLIAASGTTPFELKVDSRGPFVVTRFAITFANRPYPQDVPIMVFLDSLEADVQQEDGKFHRDQISIGQPHVYATPLGSGGVFGGCDLPVAMVIRHGSVIRFAFRETAGVAVDASLVAHGFFPSRNAVYERIGEVLTVKEREGAAPTPVGRVQIVGNQVTIPAANEGDLVFNLSTENDAEYADLPLVSMDGRPLWNPALLAVPINLTKAWYQLEGQHQAQNIISGVPTNMLASLGSTGPVGARLFDRSLKLQPGSDVVFSFINADPALAHTLYGGLVVHRF